MALAVMRLYALGDVWYVTRRCGMRGFTGMHSPRLIDTAGRGATLALLAALLLTGCGNGSPEAGGGDSAAPTGATSAGTTAQPTSPAPDASSASPTTPQSGSPSGSDSELPDDWRPEEPTVLATGQKVPEDYEPATLEHPARNVPKPVMPAEAMEETEAGAQAFMNYRADAQWYSIQTGDTSLIREVTSADCEKCTEQYDAYDSRYANGNWAAGGFEKPTILREAFVKRPDGGYNIPVSVTSSGTIGIDDNKVTARQLPFDESDAFDVYIYRENGVWRYLTSSPRGSL